MKRLGILAFISVACLLALVFPTQAAAANPILIVTSSSNPYTTFLPEIFRTEGFNEFDTADISVVTSTTLSAYDLVVLGDTSLTAAQVTTFTTWVNGGGNLIAMHPDPQLAGLLGLASSGSTLSNAYVLMNTSAGPGVGLVGQTIQFHGPAELFTLNGATSYATLYSNASTPTSNPAVTLKQAGSGQAAAFTYDLARSVAYTRQGNPAWTGEARDAANAPPIRAYNLFYGAASFDPEPDWVNLNNVQIPQADEQQRLLANLILQMNTTKKPLPRFWYLPKGLKAAVVMTGDDHGSFYSGSATASRFSDFLAASPAGCSVANWECVRATAYLFPKIVATTTLTNTQIASYISQGFEIGVHVDSATTCNDWTTSALATVYANFLASFASQFPSVPAPQTHRMHCISWSDYDSQPTIELEHGIRFDTTYYYWPSTWINDQPGLFTGSGMPMRYTDRNGNLINVYQATTQMTDESGQAYPLNINTLLDNALSGSGYYGVFTANMHNDQGSATYGYPGPGASYIVSSAQTRGVPIVSSLQMLQWLDGRNGSSFGSLAWSGNVLSFSITVGANANNLRAMLPTNAGTLGLSSLLLSGSPVSYQLQTTKGIQYAVFAASAGNYQATYGGSPLFSVSGAIIPSDVASGTTVTATGPVTVTASPDNYGSYSLNGLPSGTYTITPSKSGVGFTPASQAVTFSGADVTAVNFNLVETCPCTIFGSSIPAVPDQGPDNSVNLGIRFKSDVAGTISALRFYKAAANTGTHVGSLWTNTGTLLASATYTNETASGWQTVNLSSPVAITAGTYYVVSYLAPVGHYAEDDNFFVTSSYDNAPLHSPQDGTEGSNGVYGYSSSAAFPTSAYASANYYADVVFTPSSTTAALSSVAVNPTSVTGGTSSAGTVTLTGPAPTAGFTVTLASDNAAATPSTTSLTIPSGSSSGTFTVNTTAVATSTTAHITASNGATNVQATLTITPVATLTAVSVNPTSVVGGNSSTGTLTLNNPAPAGGAVVSLSSDSTSAVVPTTTTVAAGSTSGTFTITTSGVSSVTTAHISATYNSVTPTPATLTINPLAISSVSVNPTAVAGPNPSTGTVTMAGPAPAGGITVSLQSNSSAATVPTSVNVAANASSATFPVTTLGVSTSTAVTITASYGGANVTTTLTVNPLLSSVSVNPTAVVGPTGSTGTVTLAGPAPAGGISVSLQSNSSAATVATSVSVAANATSATFPVTTVAVAGSTPVTITASYNNVSVTATLTVNPPALSAVSVNPTSVVGGSPSTGTVTLTGPAPTGGILVSLQSNNSAVTVPTSVTVLANTSSITFQATTVAVSSSTPVTITATYASVNQTATLTVTPKSLLAIDKTVTKDNASSSKTIVTAAFTTSAANELLLAFVAADNSGSGANTTVTGITGGSLTWTLVKRTNTQLGTAEVWRAFAPAVLTNATVTATLSTSNPGSLTVVTFTGASTSGTGGSGAIGATGTGNSSTGAPTASLTTTVANSWVFGVGNDWDNATARTVPSNQTMVHQDVSTSNGDTYWVQSQTAATPVAGTVVTINDTAPTTDRYNLTIVEVLP